jgi:LDH2 family malate/lactate/ureidoglycolate dehydrogenase
VQLGLFLTGPGKLGVHVKSSRPMLQGAVPSKALEKWKPMPTLQPEALKLFTQEVFEACNAPHDEAVIVADHLVTANLMGVDSHGVIRITQYVQEIRDGTIIPGAPIVVLKETPTTAIVDGGWNFGLVAAHRAMEIAISKAVSITRFAY